MGDLKKEKKMDRVTPEKAGKEIVTEESHHLIEEQIIDQLRQSIKKVYEKQLADKENREKE